VGHSSPLSHVLERTRDTLSDDHFLLAQLDVDFERTYQRMLNSYRGFINGWFAETDKSYVVDKNRNWLPMIELVNLLDPQFKMLVCLRDLVEVYGSIEAQHQKTLLLNFPDRLAPQSAYLRADQLFKQDGLIGRALKAIEYLQDVSTRLTEHICYIAFESLVEYPVETLHTIYQWLGLEPHTLDPKQLTTKAHESDSYYRFKYRHQTFSAIQPPSSHSVSPRIRTEIMNNFAWYYQQFYPEKLPRPD